jgi:hypothetical protein
MGFLWQLQGQRWYKPLIKTWFHVLMLLLSNISAIRSDMEIWRTTFRTPSLLLCRHARMSASSEFSQLGELLLVMNRGRRWQETLAILPLHMVAEETNVVTNGNRSSKQHWKLTLRFSSRYCITFRIFRSEVGCKPLYGRYTFLTKFVLCIKKVKCTGTVFSIDFYALKICCWNINGLYTSTNSNHKVRVFMGEWFQLVLRLFLFLWWVPCTHQ